MLDESILRKGSARSSTASASAGTPLAAAEENDLSICGNQARHRQFGGTTNRWGLSLGKGIYGARYVTLDPIDFARRDYVPNSGWPITTGDLNPYYERAQSVCGLGSFSYAADGWTDGHVQPWEGPNDALFTKIFQCGSNKIFTHYYNDLLRRSDAITVYLVIAHELTL